MMAAAAGHIEVCKTLLEADADPNRRDKNGDIALDYAVRFKRSAVATLLESAPHLTDNQNAADWEELPSLTEPHDPTVRLNAADLFVRMGAHIPVDDSHDWGDAASGTDREEEPFRSVQHLAELNGLEVSDLRHKGGCFWINGSQAQFDQKSHVTDHLCQLGFRFAAGRGYWKK